MITLGNLEVWTCNKYECNACLAVRQVAKDGYSAIGICGYSVGDSIVVQNYNCRKGTLLVEGVVSEYIPQ